MLPIETYCSELHIMKLICILIFNHICRRTLETASHPLPLYFYSRSNKKTIESLESAIAEALDIANSRSIVSEVICS